MIYGYARVSTQDQNLDRQIDQLLKSECKVIYKEKITGATMNRAELKKLLDIIQKGDTIVIPDLTRLSRSTKDLFELVEIIEKKGASIKSLKETWLNTTTPDGRMFFTIMAALSQFEKDLISQRTREGLAAAKKRGHIGGRQQKLTDNEIRLLIQFHNEGNSMNECIKKFNISKSTFYHIKKGYCYV